MLPNESGCLAISHTYLNKDTIHFSEKMQWKNYCPTIIILESKDQKDHKILYTLHIYNKSNKWIGTIIVMPLDN